MEIKKVKLSRIKQGPVRHATVPAVLIERIRGYKAILGDADPLSFDEAVDGFRRDLIPDKEVEIWERIAHVFQRFTSGRGIVDLAGRREVLGALIWISAGADMGEIRGSLSRNQLAELNYYYVRRDGVDGP